VSKIKGYFPSPFLIPKQGSVLLYIFKITKHNKKKKKYENAPNKNMPFRSEIKSSNGSNIYYEERL